MYATVLQLHIALVVCSLSLFSARGLGVLLAHTWPSHILIRMSSVMMDTCLLIAGVSLWVMGQHNPIHEPWLGVKLLLLIAYISAGTYAFKYARHKLEQLASLLLAGAIVGQMIAMAITKNPLGLFSV